MKRLKYIKLALLMIPVSMYGQDIHFSQFDQTPQLLNPGLTGVVDGNHRAAGNYKNQWSSVANPYKTYALSYDLPLFQDPQDRYGYLGAGINVFRDVAGDAMLGNTTVALSASGILPIGSYQKLAAGIQGSFTQRSADISQLTWGNQFDGTQYNPSLMSGESDNVSGYSYFDAAAGVVYRYKDPNDMVLYWKVSSINVGLSAYHLTRPKQQYLGTKKDKLHHKYVFHTDMTIGFPDGYFELRPSGIVYWQGGAYEVMVGSMLMYKLSTGSIYSNNTKRSAIGGGLHYRFKDAVVPRFEFQFSEFSLGISYDVNLSSLSEVSSARGGLEISLSFVDFDALYKRR